MLLQYFLNFLKCHFILEEFEQLCVFLYHKKHHLSLNHLYLEILLFYQQLFLVTLQFPFLLHYQIIFLVLHYQNLFYNQVQFIIVNQVQAYNLDLKKVL